MTEFDPGGLLFRGLEKLGPGNDADTLHVLSQLPRRHFDVVVDAGCGAGRQTLCLVRSLGTVVHAVDLHEPFLQHLQRRAERDGLQHLVRARCMDMKDIPAAYPAIDLLWSEGAAYNIGFDDALRTWAPVLRAGGFAVISELCWLSERPPTAVAGFFQSAYPAMRSVAANARAVEAAGYRLLFTHLLPRAAWVEGYYEVLGPRARGLLSHSDGAVRQFATETLEEIEVFDASNDSYGYVFYALGRD